VHSDVLKGCRRIRLLRRLQGCMERSKRFMPRRVQKERDSAYLKIAI